jgi:predicted phosphodiesterase
MRRITFGGVLLVALVLGAAGFEALESMSIAPRVTMTVLEPTGRREMPGYTISGRGISILDADETTVTVRAWAPAPTLAVSPRGSSTLTIRLANLPERATVATAPDVSETRRGLVRVLTITGTSRQDLSYTVPGDRVVFAGLGDTGNIETFEHALSAARTMGCDFFLMLGDLVYRDRSIPRLQEILDNAPLPVYVVRGNHDHNNHRRRELLARLGPSFYAFSYGGAGFVMLDTSRQLIPGFAFESDQHEWLERTLTLPIGHPLIIVMHHAPIAGPGESRWHQMLDVGYAQRLVRDFDRAGVRLVLAGNVHSRHMEYRGDVLYMISGEGGRQRAREPVMAVVTVQSGNVAAHFEPVWSQQ